tara:strand:- start:68 stop:532 length:465 start_codon:yes stop_codon:yes gene_type:complete
MAKNIDAMRKLGMPDYKIRKELEKRKGVSKQTVSNLMLGVYTPKRPSDFFVSRMSEINNDLNRKEKRSVPNPYIKALPTLNGIINKNRRIDLIDGNLSMADLEFQRSVAAPSVSFQQSGLTTTSINPNIINRPASTGYDNLTNLEKDRLLFNNR